MSPELLDLLATMWRCPSSEVLALDLPNQPLRDLRILLEEWLEAPAEEIAGLEQSRVLQAEEKQMQLMRDEVRELAPRTFADDEIDAAFEHLPARYFNTRGPREIFRDLTLAHQFMRLQLMTEDQPLREISGPREEPRSNAPLVRPSARLGL